MMRVLLLTDSDVFAGTESHMLDLAHGLRRLRNEVLLGCPQPGALAQRAVEDGFDLVAVPKRGLVDWRAARQLRKVCREREIDLIHSHNSRTALIAAMTKALTPSIRCVATQHLLSQGYAARRGVKAAVYRMAHHWVDRRTDHVIAISNAAREGSIARGEASEAKITVIPNGIGTTDDLALRSPADVRKELGVSPRGALVVCAARLEPEKDISTLIDAMAIVVRDLPEAVCAIAGDGRLRKEIEAKVVALGLGRCINLLGFRTDVPSLMSAGDLFALPSKAEPFGLVLLEAMSLGKAVVATAAGGPLEIVQQGRTGILVEPGNAQEMAQAILKILGSRQLREEMGKAGEARFRAEYTVQRMAADTLEVYRRVLGEEPVDSAAAVSATASV